MSVQVSNDGRAGVRHTRAFTLVELLVVIGIIAILMSVLMPALGQAKRKAQATACMADLRQIGTAMFMFAQDNKGHLPRPYGVGQLSSDQNLVKVAAWLQKVAGATGHVDMEDDKGALWKYIPGQGTREQLLMCPGDTGEALAGHPRNPSYPRNTSYSFNSRIQREERGLPLTGIRLGTVKSASERILIYEELAPNDTWCIMAMSTDDLPSGRHGIKMRQNSRNNPNSKEYFTNGRGMHCFFDGHVESLAPAQLLPPWSPTGGGQRSYHGPLTEKDTVALP